MLAWFAKGGGEVSPQVLIEERAGAGVSIVARGPDGVAVGETIVRVPLSLCLSVETCRRSPALAPIFEAFPDVLQYPAEVLAIALMHGATRPEQSDWAVFVDSLPKAVNAMIFWSDQELAELSDTMAFHMTKMLQRQLATDWENIHAPIKAEFPSELGQISYARYSWGAPASVAIPIAAH